MVSGNSVEMPYKNSEKRKEKSRDAARCRRGKESEVFYELANCLPMQASVISQLDKASVMRLCISTLKIQQILQQNNWSGDERKGIDKGTFDHLFPKALGGFIFILSHEGDIVYVNESVVKYLGIQQIELMGQSIFDFSDPRDEDEIREAVSVRPHGTKIQQTDSEERVFFIRMKCTLTSKGRNVNLKSASYKVIKFTGHLLMPPEQHQTGAYPYLLAIGEPIPHPSNIEVPMDTHTFLSKHDMNMKFTYCDDRVKDLLNYSGDELLGRSLYEYHHAVDSEAVERSYKDLLSKGQTTTSRYRFMAHGGGWAWVVTQATVIYSNRNQKVQWVVCVHYVLSEIEERELVLSDVQLDHHVRENMNKLMRPCTEGIFSPRPDTDCGYYIPCDMRSEIKMVSANEPEDLRYLAPDVDLPFPWQDVRSGRSDEEGISPPPARILETMKIEPGLSPTLCNAHDMQSMNTFSPASSVSPSSATSSRMNSPRDYANTVSPLVMHQIDEFFHNMDVKCDSKDEDSDVRNVDETGRAPFIPMTGSQDLCLVPVNQNAILTMQNEMDPALHCQTEYIFRPNKPEDIFEERPPPPKPSIRDMICGSTVVASIKQPPDTMFRQIKRSLDMNSLEKGPPERKHQRLSGREPQPQPQPQPQLQEVPTMRSQKMLFNLLVKGHDPSGYRTMPLSMGASSLLKGTDGSDQLCMPLECLTQRDCEVNAPITYGTLLNGADLLTALD